MQDPTAEAAPTPRNDQLQRKCDETADLAECARVSLRTHSSRRELVTGIDTIHLLTDAFSVALNNTLTIQNTVDASTGESNEVPLYRDGGHVVEGGKAYANTPLAQLTIYSVDALSVQCSLPRLIRSDNTEEIRTPEQLMLALASLERHLQTIGVKARLTDAKITRLDLCRTATLPRMVRDYEPALKHLQFPRMNRTRYEGTGRRWSNSLRGAVFYDKGREQTGEDSRTARLEYRLQDSRSVRRHTGISTTSDLLDNLSPMNDAYTGATDKLLSADLPEDVSTTGKGVRALLEALQDVHDVATKAALAIFLHKSDADEREELYQHMRDLEREGIIPTNSARRLEKKLQKLQPAAGTLADHDVSPADLLRELQDAFC